MTRANRETMSHVGRKCRLSDKLGLIGTRAKQDNHPFFRGTDETTSEQTKISFLRSVGLETKDNRHCQDIDKNSSRLSPGQIANESVIMSTVSRDEATESCKRFPVIESGRKLLSTEATFDKMTLYKRECVERKCSVMIVGQRCIFCYRHFKCQSDLDRHVSRRHNYASAPQKRRKKMRLTFRIGQEVVSTIFVKPKHLKGCCRQFSDEQNTMKNGVNVEVSGSPESTTNVTRETSRARYIGREGKAEEESLEKFASGMRELDATIVLQESSLDEDSEEEDDDVVCLDEWTRAMNDAKEKNVKSEVIANFARSVMRLQEKIIAASEDSRKRKRAGGRVAYREKRLERGEVVSHTPGPNDDIIDVSFGSEVEKSYSIRPKAEATTNSSAGLTIKEATNGNTYALPFVFDNLVIKEEININEETQEIPREVLVRNPTPPTEKHTEERQIPAPRNNEIISINRDPEAPLPRNNSGVISASNKRVSTDVITRSRCQGHATTVEEITIDDDVEEIITIDDDCVEILEPKNYDERTYADVIQTGVEKKDDWLSSKEENYLFNIQVDDDIYKRQIEVESDKIPTLSNDYTDLKEERRRDEVTEEYWEEENGYSLADYDTFFGRKNDDNNNSEKLEGLELGTYQKYLRNSLHAIGNCNAMVWIEEDILSKDLRNIFYSSDLNYI